MFLLETIIRTKFLLCFLKETIRLNCLNLFITCSIHTRFFNSILSYLFNFIFFILVLSFKFLIFLFVINFLNFNSFTSLCNGLLSYAPSATIVLFSLHNNGWELENSINCSFNMVTSCFDPVSILIDIGILKSSLIIDILDVLCFLTWTK